MLEAMLLLPVLLAAAGGSDTSNACQLSVLITTATTKYPYFVDGKRYMIHPALIRAIIQQESSGNPKARSTVGARGLMQLMPQTAELLKCDWTKIEDPTTNVDCGVKFVAALLTYTKGDLLKAISGYNGGTHSTEKSPLKGGRIADNPETKAYVKSVLNFFEGFRVSRPPSCPGSTLANPTASPPVRAQRPSPQTEAGEGKGALP
jgi:soluble lytic murein transglycosylase-like protein